MGCDVPGIEALHINQASQALERADVVMGPATDGGYWLIASKRQHDCLWQNMPWGGPEVAARTREACRQHALTLTELVTLSDVDEAEDLIVWEREVAP